MKHPTKYWKFDKHPETGEISKVFFEGDGTMDWVQQVHTKSLWYEYFDDNDDPNRLIVNHQTIIGNNNKTFQSSFNDASVNMPAKKTKKNIIIKITIGIIIAVSAAIITHYVFHIG